MTSIIDKLKQLTFLTSLSGDEIKKLAEHTHYVQIRKGEVIFRAEEPAECCYVLFYGSVKLLKLQPGGQEGIISFAKTGDFLAGGVMRQSPILYPLSAVALEDTGLFKISRKNFLDYWLTIKVIDEELKDQVLHRVRDLQADKVMSNAPVSWRIAEFLLRTLDSQKSQSTNVIYLKLTRKDLAEKVGTTVETTIRILTEWRENGWIQIDDRLIQILNRSELEKIIRTQE